MEVFYLFWFLTSGFLLYLVEEVKGFENAECRSYTFANGNEAVLIPLPTQSEVEDGN
jgi:hypothetical protein